MPRSLYVQADQRLLPSGERSRRHLRVEIVAPRRPPRMPVNLALVLDRSGSMHGEKLDLVREGAIRAVRSLGEDDRLSAVIYNERVVVLVPSRVADDVAKDHAETVLRRISARGDTDLCGGWLSGCEQVSQALDPTRLGRCLLLTDGFANRGITDPETIVSHAAGLRKDGVTTSTLGVGRGFDEDLLRRMAEAGGGNFYFAEHATQLADFIAGEIGEALRVAAREAELVACLPAGASASSPNPFRTRSESGNAVFELGSLVADQVLSLVLRLDFPQGEEGDMALVECRLRDADGAFEGSVVEQSFTYSSHEASDSEPRDREVDREVAAAYAARARQRAAKLGREGATDQGSGVLRKTAARINEYAGDSPELLALVSALEQEAAKLEQMDDLDHKRLAYSTFRGLRSRGEDGMTIGTGRFLFDRTVRVMSRPESLEGAEAPFFVAAVTSDPEGTRLVEAAGQALAAADEGAFAFAVIDGGARIVDPGPDELLSDDEELGLAYALGGSKEVVKIAFVRSTLRGGSLSHWHPAERVAIVSLGGWDEAAGAPAEALVAYQMLLQASRHGRAGWDPTAVMHRDVRGCWGDHSETQAEIEAKIAACDLCSECRRLYEAAGIGVEQFLRLIAAVGALARR